MPLRRSRHDAPDKKASLQYWTAPPGAPRPASTVEPKPAAGDSAVQTLVLDYDKKGIAKGELTLPKAPAGQMPWHRPVVVNGAGQTSWSAATPTAPKKAG